MDKMININTEGVLILASSIGLMSEYKTNDFNYDFPDGLNKLLIERKIIALMTSSGNNLLIDIKEESELDILKYDKVIEQYLTFGDDDDFLVLSHADFTMICNKDGNYKNHKWPIQSINGIKKGTYRIDIGIEDVSERYDEFKAYFRLEVAINKTNNVGSINEIFEISE